MVFRDDRQVLIERIAVLEREAAESNALRARIGQLEEENYRLMSEIAALRARYEPPAPPPAPVPRGRFASGNRVIALRVQGPNGIRDVTFDQDIIKMGRLESTHLPLVGGEVSRMHAVIERTDEGFTIIDLGSSSGTLVNGQKIAKKLLASGDVIGIGPFSLYVAV
jgi:hypothetical protein